MKTRDELIEDMARAICISEGYHPDIGGERGGKIELNWEAHIKQAEFALDALLAELPDDGMIESDAKHYWNLLAMKKPE